MTDYHWLAGWLTIYMHMLLSLFFGQYIQMLTGGIHTSPSLFFRMHARFSSLCLVFSSSIIQG
jgi:hypothetical protein